MKKSNFLNLDIKDLLRGGLLALIAIVGTSVLAIVESGDILCLFEWATLKPIIIAGISGFVAYILKNLLTNSEDKIGKTRVLNVGRKGKIIEI